MGIKCPKCQLNNPVNQQYCGECGTQLPPAEEISAPLTETLETPKEELTTGSTFVGRYQIIEELGKGGMGKVYKAQDTELKEKVAIKLLRPEIAADKKTIERFRNELKFARKIRHKNVCQMYDLNKEEGSHYITMEYVDGKDLKGMIRMMGQLSSGKTIFIAKQICEGLVEAHRLGVVHRDLKPQNIMIDEDGNARIMDFGIARSLKTKGITAAGVMIGTPEYMSPEQVEGKEVDERSDIYSLGVILYEMVTGRVPFEGDTPFTIGVKHKSESPKDPKELNTQLPEDLNLVILRCLEKDKEKRYQSAGDVRAELMKIEEGIPTTERIEPKRKPTTSKEITVTFRKRWMFISTFSIVAIIVALAFIFLKSRKDVIPPGNKVLVVLPFENLGAPQDEYFADGITDEITNRLSALHRLDVISRNSAIQYKGTKKTIKQIKEELNVDYMVSGTVRWDKSTGKQGRVRVSPKLIRASDDTQLWSETYERDIESIFKIQSEIAEEVAKQLDLKVLEPERKALYEKPTSNLEAYDLYLKGIEHARKGRATSDSQEFRLSIQMLERATELDPDFALAYVDQFYNHSWMYFDGSDRSEERLAKSKAAVDKALALQPDLPVAQMALAYYYYRGFLDYDRALEILENVLKARPNISNALLAWIQRRQGNWEQSLATLERVFNLNPRNSNLAHNQATTYFALRRYNEAEIWLNRTLSITPNHFEALSDKIQICVLSKGDMKEALTLTSKLPEHPQRYILFFNLYMYNRNFREALDLLSSMPYDSFGVQHSYFHKDLAFAYIYYTQKSMSLMKTHAESAFIAIKKELNKHPDDPRLHAALGLADAYLGNKDEAIREGNRALEIYPESMDALGGPIYVYNLARIYAVVGEFEKSIAKLEYLMSIPGGLYIWEIANIHTLQLEPQWDPLRNQAMFQSLLEKYSDK